MPKNRARLSTKQILAWAQAHRAYFGRWPTRISGRVRGVPGKSWDSIDKALYIGGGGLPGGSTLAWLLYEELGVLGHQQTVPLNEKQILGWATRHQERTGQWPGLNTGPVVGFPGLTWRTVDQALRKGQRGLPGGSSLARLLQHHLGVCNMSRQPRLTLRQILDWADHHYYHTGQWPHHFDGRILAATEEKWRNIDNALRYGLRGIRGGSSLARLLAEKRGYRNPHGLPSLSEAMIIRWAEIHFRRTGKWPTTQSGAIPHSNAAEDTWARVDQALVAGYRGLPGGSSLATLLAAYGKKRHKHRQPRLTERLILGWMDYHRQITGKWPYPHSGAVLGAPGEKWRNLDNALRYGLRGMRGGSSMHQLRLKRGRGW